MDRIAKAIALFVLVACVVVALLATAVAHVLFWYFFMPAS